jgi:uncharacterized DUF497 family protein
MTFEWDIKKSEINYRKHQVRFEEAQTVFLDKRAQEYFDDEHSLEENRYIRIGLSQKLRILIVCFSEPDMETIRLISARKAEASERKVYEKEL